jgi:hypothetical protein
MSNTKKAKAEPKPELLGKGRYAIHQTPEGDGVISYRPDGSSEDQHQVVPAKFWAVVTGMLRGEITSLKPVELMKMLMGK